MSYDDNIYARIITGQVTQEEELQLRASGEWDEIMSIVEETDNWSLPEYKLRSQFDSIQVKIEDKKTKGTIIPLYKIIAGIASIFILGIIGYTFLSSSETVISSSNRENVKYAFVDGTSALLNAGTQLEYDKIDYMKNRSVTLKGEAIFEVETGNPFKVNTPSGTVTVLGTVFNIRSRNGFLHVTCYEGTVQVQVKQKSVILEGGDVVNFDPNGQFERSTSADTTPSWKNGKSRFKKEPLINVIKELERQFDISISWTKSDDLFSGEFDHKNLEKALEKVCLPMNLSFKIINNKKVEIY